ncbi:MAG: sigma 54-interacting transcriptional regulator [Deltaproteobacteria bacterium]|nr:MAG: sigma 54-interacting transcriptional regulator [Deltaproteobacteria bacterium]
MDENEFFREAPLRICGNLEIEEGMFSTLQFLRKKMPVDRIFLQFVDAGLNAMRIVAMATPKEATKDELLTPLSSKALQEIMDLINEYKYYQQKKPNFIWLFKDNPKENSAIREIFELHKMQVTSLMVIPLKATGKVLGGGSLVLATEGERKFNQKHADLISLLKEPFVIAMSNVLRYRDVIRLKELLADDNRYLHGELRRLSGDEIVGANFGLRDVMCKVQQVAALDSPVLLLGETGVGKDVIANTIHYSSSRSNGPFVSVNCGAIPDTLIDSELFGHEKGAFTGALSQKRGRFERADKGTIFLDEIGELPLQAQVRLLNVLQSKEIERVGGVKTIPLDIRIIAATNRNLEEMLRLNQFREDLWFRLNVFPIWIPPLRDRMADVPALVQHFISLKARELKLPDIPKLSPGAIVPLMEYHWPGNVRELENIIERALILNPTGPLSFEHMNLGQLKKPLESQGESKETDNLDEANSRHIRQILLKTKGKVNGPDGAAALLGINPSTLRNRMKKLGIDYGTKSKS